MSSSQNNLTVDEAIKILKSYSCVQIKVMRFELDKEVLRQAIKLITGLSDHENFGICADNLQQGLQALRSYLKALNYNFELNKNPFPSEDTAVYIKFNTQTQKYYLDSYQGTYRGVLISCQSEDDSLVGTYGHFPLDLFESTFENE
ncbi:Domain of unknown function DUF1824 [Rippkaea orientalis PCC 8801]|uniref:DUF1824 domain-containing protein n=1 Tax=Rippkaea orientalis (strain PCC 8801 / RF-1) TaxID=41431 RepID=B7K0A9_RIPO1|nr:DUF1824 family protein [Rippkaea orientalis]ACK67393.1 Domain of unknown function DUF1824 [Rippkaea orientalis PCC 8801]